jgi:hypothetical protein
MVKKKKKKKVGNVFLGKKYTSLNFPAITMIKIWFVCLIKKIDRPRYVGCPHPPHLGLFLFFLLILFSI